MGRQSGAGSGTRPVGDDCSIRHSVRSQVANSQGDDGGRHGARARRLRAGGKARGSRRHRCHRAPWGPRLSPAQLRLSAFQSAQRRIWRPARGAHALSGRDRASRARSDAKGDAARGAHHWKRLERRRAHPRRCRRVRQSTEGGRPRFRLHLLRRHQRRHASHLGRQYQCRVCREGETRGRHRHAHRRTDRHAQAGRNHYRRRQSRHVALARAMLDDPHWGWHAAQKLGAEVPRPKQYQRAAPKVWAGASYRD